MSQDRQNVLTSPSIKARPLDLAWLSGSALIALALILWTPDGLSTRAVGAHSGEAPMDEEGADEGEGGEALGKPWSLLEVGREFWS